MWQSGERLKKPHSFVILRGLKGIRDKDFFSKIRLEHFCHILSNCQISEKSNERISRKGVANGRTNERTRAKFKVLSNSSTNQKLCHLKNNTITEVLN